MKKSRKIILASFIALMFVFMGSGVLPIYAEINESVTLRPTPKIASTVSGIETHNTISSSDDGYTPPVNENGVLVFGNSSAGSSSAGTVNSYTPPAVRAIDTSTIVMTSLADLEATLADESSPPALVTHLSGLTEMSGLLDEAPITDYILPSVLYSAISPLSSYVTDGTVGVENLIINNLFDVWFEGCETMDGECIMLTLDLSEVTSGIFAFVQYQDDTFTVVPSCNIIPGEGGLVTVSFEQITPVALLVIPQSQIDSALNPAEPPEDDTPVTRYMGDPAYWTIFSLLLVIIVEGIAILAAYNWEDIVESVKRQKPVI